MPEHFDGARCLEDLRFAEDHFRRRGLESFWLDVLRDLAMTELELGDFVGARAHLESALQLDDLSAHDHKVCTGHLNLAEVELALGNPKSAARHWAAGATGIEFGYMAEYYIGCVLVGAMCCVGAGHHAEGALLYGVADALSRASGERFEPYEAERREADLVVLTNALGDSESVRIRAEGEQLTFAESMRLAHGTLSGC